MTYMYHNHTTIALPQFNFLCKFLLLKSFLELKSNLQLEVSIIFKS
jgi:hypothetical protein